MAARAVFVSAFFIIILQKQLIYDFLAGNNYPNSPHLQGVWNLPHKCHLYLIVITFKKMVMNSFVLFVSGLHAVADIYCDCCKTTLGWKYEQAYESSQKYKEGKFIIELAHMIKENGWENESWSLQQTERQTDKFLSGSEKFRPILFYWFRFYFMKVFFFFVLMFKKLRTKLAVDILQKLIVADSWKKKRF